MGWGWGGVEGVMQGSPCPCTPILRPDYSMVCSAWPTYGHFNPSVGGYKLTAVGCNLCNGVQCRGPHECVCGGGCRVRRGLIADG